MKDLKRSWRRRSLKAQKHSEGKTRRRRPTTSRPVWPATDVYCWYPYFYTSSSGPIAPWYCWYPYFYTPMNYSRMHIQIYYIQYPSMYPSCVSPRPVVTSDNLVKRDLNCSKEGEKSIKQDSKYLQPRWCPSGLSHTQKRRLQRLRRQESMEQQAEVEPTKSAATKKV